MTGRPARHLPVVALAVVVFACGGPPGAAAADRGTPRRQGSAGRVWAVPATATGLVSLETALRSRIRPDGVTFLGVWVSVGGEADRLVLTNAATPEALLQALEVNVGRSDLVRPARSGVLAEGARIEVIRIRSALVTVTEPIPFATSTRSSTPLAATEAVVVKAGVTGRALRTYRVTYWNGRETARRLVSELILSAPVPQVIERGTSQAPGGPHGSATGQASWYARSGLCAASLGLPLGTVVSVRNLDTGKSVTVIIDDRGPYGLPGRIIGLCQTAFAEIAPLDQGVAGVSLTW
jgi:hypothetical protein